MDVIVVPAVTLNKRICLIGAAASDAATVATAHTFGVPIVTSETGEEYAQDQSCTTIFVLNSFEGVVFNALYKSKQPLLGVPALQQLASKNEPLPNNTRPLFNLSMSGVVVCFTGFRNKDELVSSFITLINFS